MENLPPNYKVATVARRLLSCAVNFLTLGILLIISENLASALGAKNPPIAAKSILAGLLIVYWVACALATSPGAAVFMLKRTTENYGPLTRLSSLKRTLPFLVAGLIVFFPVKSSALVQALHSIAITLIGLASFAETIAVVATQRTLVDRIFKTTMIQLSLPDRLMPTVGGRRLM